MHFAQASTEHCEILRVYIYKASFNCAPACHHRVACDLLFVEIKVMRTMNNKSIHFAEGAFVEQQVQAFAGGQSSLFVLCVNAGLSAAESRLRFQVSQFLDFRYFAHEPLSIMILL